MQFPKTIGDLPVEKTPGFLSRLIQGSFLTVVGVFLLSYAFLNFTDNFSRWIMDQKYEQALEQTLVALDSEQKKQIAGVTAMEQAKRLAEEQLLQKRIQEINEADANLSVPEINIRSIPKITNMDGGVLTDSFGKDLEMKETTFQNAEEVINHNLAFIKQSDYLGVIIGHSSSDKYAKNGKYGRAFAFLAKTVSGKVTEITINGKRYQVVGTKVVDGGEAGAQEILRETKIPTIKLVTCYPIGTVDERLVVELVETVNIQTI